MVNLSLNSPSLTLSPPLSPLPGRLIGAMRAVGVIGGKVKDDPRLGDDIPKGERERERDECNYMHTCV